MTGGFLSREGVDGLLLATSTYVRNSKDNLNDTDRIKARPSAWNSSTQHCWIGLWDVKQVAKQVQHLATSKNVATKKKMTIFTLDPTSSKVLQHFAACCYTVAKHVSLQVSRINVASCYVKMLRAFGWASKKWLVDPLKQATLTCKTEILSITHILLKENTDYLSKDRNLGNNPYNTDRKNR